MPTTLAEWLAYLEALHPSTIDMGLERIARVRDRMGLAPDFPVITVAGTNGKGSVCAFLATVFHAAGYRAGVYTSPHLLRYNERVRVDLDQADDVSLLSRLCCR
jgi:dihydrofolate synthase/folylpolyglutamate synthase